MLSEYYINFFLLWIYKYDFFLNLLDDKEENLTHM